MWTLKVVVIHDRTIRPTFSGRASCCETICLSHYRVSGPSTGLWLYRQSLKQHQCPCNRQA